MKTLLSFVSASVLAVSFSFAQVPGIPGLSRAPVATGPQGTTLGANTTSSAGGIDLANRVKLRGYVDFMYENVDDEGYKWPPPPAPAPALPDGRHAKGFGTTADVDFLFDFSPVTAELHTELNSGGVDLEQAFIRYSVNRDFNISMGRQLSTLGFEGDEAPNLYQVSNAYLKTDADRLRRNYVDGIRANFNNGRFGFSIGLHNRLFPDLAPTTPPSTPASYDNTNNGDMAVDLQAAIMIVPGLEGRLGYASESRANDNDIEQFNAWLAYNDRALTLAIEFDDWNVGTSDIWDVMLMGNYQFNDFFGLTLRYSHEDKDNAYETDRITLYTSFTVTDNLSLGLEYSHASVDAATDYDVDEFYAESLLSF